MTPSQATPSATRNIRDRLDRPDPRPRNLSAKAWDRHPLNATTATRLKKMAIFQRSELCTPTVSEAQSPRLSTVKMMGYPRDEITASDDVTQAKNA